MSPEVASEVWKTFQQHGVIGAIAFLALVATALIYRAKEKLHLDHAMALAKIHDAHAAALVAKHAAMSADLAAVRASHELELAAVRSDARKEVAGLYEIAFSKFDGIGKVQAEVAVELGRLATNLEGTYVRRKRG